MRQFRLCALDKQSIRAYFSSEQKVAGATSYCYDSGRARGTRAIQVKTGGGLSFEVLPDRGMDICKAEYCGVPISWEGKCGVTHPSYYEAGGMDVLRTFLGGLVTTCGLTNAGDPCADDGMAFPDRQGLHGRADYLAAEDVCVRQGWEGEEYKIALSGKIRESRLYCENLLLTREISCKMGENRLFIRDRVENLGFVACPLMLLYHINFGYPIVSEHTKLYTGYKKAEPLNENARRHPEAHSTFPPPLDTYAPDNFVFSQPLYGDDNFAVLFNEDLDVGVSVRYRNSQLPYMTEWIQASKQEYVVGIEPGNCLPEGRVNARERNRLEYLGAGESKEITIEIGIVENSQNLKQYSKGSTAV